MRLSYQHYLQIRSSKKKKVKLLVAFILFLVFGVSSFFAVSILLNSNKLFINPVSSGGVVKNRSGKAVESKISVTPQGDKFSFEVENNLADLKVSNADIDPKKKEGLIFVDKPSDKDNQLATSVIHVNDTGWRFDNAQVTLKKLTDKPINAILTCPTWDFDTDAGTCKNWQIADIEFSNNDSSSISFNVKHFSAYAGAHLEILNFHSHLTQGDRWEVRFNTYGTSDLVIEPTEDTVYGEDISYIGFYCGENEISQSEVFNGNKISIPNYSCEGHTSKIVNTAVTPGPHTLHFLYGESDEYAHNFACDSGTLDDTCTVSTVQAMTNGYTISGTGNLTITSTGSLTTTATQSFAIDIDGDVTIQASGSIAGNVSSLTANNVTIAGSINASSKGYAGVAGGTGSGTGGGSGAVASGGAGGAGYGGAGGVGTSSYAGGSAHGSITQPNLFGASGGGMSGATSGAGGGSVKIVITGTLDLSGSITATGGNGAGVTTAAAGGGAGGSIWIEAPTISGSGTIAANGGAGLDTSNSDGGGGGGGRIALYYTTISETLVTTAYGGIPGTRFGGAGTIYKKPSGDTYGDLIIDNNNKSATTYITPFGLTAFTETLILDELTLRNHGAVQVSSGTNVSYTTLTWSDQGVIIYNGGTFTLFNGSSDVTVSSTSTLITNATITFDSGDIAGVMYANAATTFTDLNLSGNLTTYNNASTEVYKLNVTITNDLTVTGTGTMNLDGKGFAGSGEATGYGTGGGTGTSNNAGAAGAGHGGTGGMGTSVLAVGITYGSVTEPDSIGSSGGGANGGNGGAGGGAVKLVVGGTFSHAGSISVNGATGTGINTGAGGGGSGGSVWIDANAISGSGSITANGGAGLDTSSSDGGGGGGGRIALHYSTYSDGLTLTSYGGTPTARFGGAGTIYLEPAGDTYGDVIIDNNNRSTTTYLTPFGLTTFPDPITFDSLTLRNHGALKLESGTDIDYSSLTWSDEGVIIYSGGTFPLFNGSADVTVSSTSTLITNNSITFGEGSVAGTMYANAAVTFGTLNLSGTLTTYTNATTETYKLDVTTIGDVTITSAGSVNLAAKGFAGGTAASGYGTGAGTGSSGSAGAGGGGYGGSGGMGSSTLAGGSAHGSITEPFLLGGGGGGVGGESGGWGGGAAKFVIGGDLAHAGTITVAGGDGTVGTTSAAPGGGSGGSVWIQAVGITGDGTISANGGNGYDSSSADGGGGGGGRIALYYTSYSDGLTITAYGGTATSRFGGAGTIYLKPAGDTYGDVIIDNNNRTITSFVIPFGITSFPTTETFDNLTLRNQGSILISSGTNISYNSLTWSDATLINYSGGTFPLFNGTSDVTVSATSTLIVSTPTTFDSGDVAGTLYANSPLTFTDLNLSGTLSTYNNTTAELYEVGITTTGDFTVTSAATINLTGKGFSGGASGAGNGSGGGAGTSASGGAGGGGYGGAGGSSAQAGGSTYGSSSEPSNLGSGGGGMGGSSSGGAGGGSLKFVSGGTLTLGAAVTVDGNAGVASSPRFGGGGSGGSIWIVAQSLAGAGNLNARGGTATSAGGGGGGRISVWSGTSTYSGTLSVIAGGNGSAGTTVTDYTGPSTTLAEICDIAGNGCTVSGEAADPQEAYTMEALTGSSTESDTSIESAQISIKDTDTGFWYSNVSGEFDQASAYYFDISTVDQTLPYTGTINWSADVSELPFVIDNTYLATIAIANPQITTYSTESFVFSNSPPTVSSLDASQAASGVVNITYGVTDIESASTSIYALYNLSSTLTSDLDTGTGGVVVSSVSLYPASGTIMIDDEFITYTGKSGSTLTGITRGANNTRNVSHTSGADIWVRATSLSGDAGAGVVNGAGKAIVWTAKSDIDGLHTAAIKFRVVSNDGASSSMLHYLSTTNKSLDTKDPVFSSNFIIDNSVSGSSVYIPCTDESTLYMKVGTPSDLSGVSAVAQASPQTAAELGITISDELSIYGQCIDDYSNSTTIRTATIPPVAPNMFYQDVSNIDLDDYREFIAWGVVDEPALGFASYKIYRKVDSGSYALLQTITDRTLNYLVDQNLSTSSSYSYKIAVVDDNGNISAYSSVLTDTPDGDGGTDLSVPSISSISVSNISATQATLAWTTNKFSNSTVYYEATSSYPGSNKADYERSQGVPSIVTSHSVILSGLTPSTTYSYLVESVDASDNSGTSSNNAYQFTTSAGPVISNLTVIEAFDDEVTITWNTDIDADSEVIYSENANLSSPTFTEGSDDLTQNHSVTIDDLEVGNRYYFYVTSTDGSSNTTQDKNVVAGVINYYTFSTTADEVSPVISSVATALVGEKGATITWLTDEDATSIVNWGATNSLGSQQAITSVYTTQHSISLSDLTANTQYYYQVVSADRAANSTTDSTVRTFTTNNVTTVTTTTTVEIEPDLTAAGLEDEVADALSNIVEDASSSVISRVLEALAKNPNLEDIGEDDMTDLLIEITGKALSAPTIGGSRVTVEAGSTNAVVTWVTDKPANSLVAYVKDTDYQDGAANPYTIEAGDSGASTLSHSVTLEGLEPETTYHVQTRSKGRFGPLAESLDTVFTTTSITPDIASVEIENIKETGVELSWNTNIPTRSVITISDAVSGEAEIFENPNFIRDHTFETDELSPSTGYTAQIKSIDEAGVESESSVLSFFTVLNENPPQISDVRVVTSLIPGKVEQVQTIISWRTNKPSTSKVLFEEGVKQDGDLKQAASTDSSLRREHIIISSSFAPGKVYSYKVESTDTGGNTATSNNFTLLTPRPRESVVDLIVKNLEDMFGFLK